MYKGRSLLRLTAKAHYYPSARMFSSTANVQLDLSNLYSKLTGWRRKTTEPQVVDPTKVDDTERSSDSMHEEGPRKLKIIGKPKSIEEDWDSVRQYAEFDAWPTQHHRKDLKSEDIHAALSQLDGVDFSDISARFESVKRVSESLKIAIPDSVLTSLNSLEDLKSHLLSSAKPFDERQPDAIYLNAEDFIGTNITISDPVAERKSQKQKMQELFEKAKAAQNRAADDILQSS